MISDRKIQMHFVLENFVDNLWFRSSLETYEAENYPHILFKLKSIDNWAYYFETIISVFRASIS